MSQQSCPPASVVVSCDTDDPAIGELVRKTQSELGERLPQIIYTFRPHTGVARLNQVRNNGLRALDEVVSPDDREIVVLLDGDTMLATDTLERHESEARRGAELVIPYRINLDEVTTERVVSEPLNLPDLCGLISEKELQGLLHRHRRYERQLFLKQRFPGWLKLVKDHKPKVIGGHHAISVRVMRLVNGFDEGYTGYGYDDDDITRRIYRIRPRVGVAITVKDSHSLHLWHPTRAPGRPTDAPGYERFMQSDLPMSCEHGWATPSDQPDTQVSVFGSGEPS